MALFVKIDFRTDGKLGGWYTRDEYVNYAGLTTTIAETRVRDVLIAVADQIDPLEDDKEAQS